MDEDCKNLSLVEQTAGHLLMGTRSKDSNKQLRRRHKKRSETKN
jgi:hypothetical protein